MQNNLIEGPCRNLKNEYIGKFKHIDDFLEAFPFFLKHQKKLNLVFGINLSFSSKC